nr:PP0621 family protein [Aromatoleum diolicum]
MSRIGRGDSKAGGSGRPRALAEPERMLGCEHCGLHVPESEGVRDGDAFFCCDEHRRLGARH